MTDNDDKNKRGPGRGFPSNRGFAPNRDRFASSRGPKPFGAKPFGNKPFGGGERDSDRDAAKPFGNKSYAKPHGNKPFGNKPYGDKSYGKPRDDDRRPRFGRDKDGPQRSRPAPIGDVLPAEAPEERIAKVIARAGIASRRDAEAMIAEGRVTLEGEVVTSPAINVPLTARITVDGEPLPERERTRLWLFHKPRGLVTTARDPEGRPTVFEQLPEDMPRVVSIGRLDINTEGLLLLTNDGGLARVVSHPSTGWLRRYKVRAHGDITQAELDRLADGITIDEIEYGPVEARLDRVQGDNVWLTLGLREGKNREVKRILEHLGLSVNRLIRLSFGPFQLGDLEPGLVEEVRTKVLKEQLGAALAEEAGVDFQKPVREPVSMRPPRPYQDEPDGPGDESDAETERREREMARAAERRERHRAVWRADELDTAPPKKGRIPRRGSDPKQAREALSARRRQRLGSIEAVDGKTVKVERFVGGPEEDRKFRSRKPGPRDREERRESSGARPDRFARAAGPGGRGRRTDGEGAAPARKGGFAPRPDTDTGRPAAGFRKSGFGKPFPAGDDRRGGRPSTGGGRFDGDRSGSDRAGGGRTGGGRPGASRFGGSGFGGSGFGGSGPEGGRPGGGKPGGRPPGGRPTGSRPTGGKPGGRGR